MIFFLGSRTLLGTIACLSCTSCSTTRMDPLDLVAAFQRT
jgi:hypothetical protein